MRDKIDAAKKMAIPLVVLFVMVENMPVAVGSYVQYDRKIRWSYSTRCCKY